MLDPSYRIASVKQLLEALLSRKAITAKVAGYQDAIETAIQGGDADHAGEVMERLYAMRRSVMAAMRGAFAVQIATHGFVLLAIAAAPLRASSP